MVSFRALLTLTAAAGAGYMAARQLLSEEAPQQIDRLPEAARRPAEKARARLIRGRERAREAVRAGRVERETAERELMAEYRRKTGRM